MRNISWSLLEHMLRILVGFFVTVWLIRYLEPAAYGQYVFVTSFVAIFSIIAKLGSNNLIAKNYCDGVHNRDQFISEFLLFRLLGAIGAYSVTLVCAWAFFLESDSMLLIAVLSIVYFLQVPDIVEFYHQAKVDIKPIVVSKLLQVIIAAGVRVFGILNDWTLLQFVLVSVFEVGLVGFCYLIIYYKIDRGVLRLGHYTSAIVDLWRQSWPIVISNVAMVAYLKTDNIMLYQLAGKDAVGIYAAATKISEAWYFLPTIISATFFPAILSAQKESQEQFEDSFKSVMSIIIYIGLSVSVFLSVFSEQLIELLYGTQFSESIVVLRIHAWSGLLIAVGIVASKWIVAQGLQRLFIIRTITGLISNVILNYVLIPEYGVTGAAIATLISVFMANVVSYLFSSQLTPLLKLMLESIKISYALNLARRST